MSNMLQPVSPDPSSVDLPVDPDQDLSLRPVDPAYAKVLRLTALFSWVPLVIGAIVIDQLVIRSQGGPTWLLTVAAILVAAAAIMIIPTRRYTRIGYAMGPNALRVASGYYFRVDSIVPFVRVQHIDVGQGPIERRYGLSHLVVHTSGTHNSMVTLPGLPQAEAAAIRDTIRSHIKSDFA